MCRTRRPSLYVAPLAHPVFAGCVAAFHLRVSNDAGIGHSYAMGDKKLIAWLYLHSAKGQMSSDNVRETLYATS